MVGSGFRETRRRGSACVVSARGPARDALNRFRLQGIGQDDPKQYPDCMHDASYKLLFSHAEMIKDLLQGFVPQSWVQALDFSTLEKVNASYVADDLRNRHDDVVWRVRFQDHWLYVYLLLEFQSTVDRFMAVRILSYTGLLYQDLIRGQSLHQDRLPPVLPIVLYNGEPRWKAAVDLSALIHPAPQELLPYQPQQRYLLLDEGAHSEQALAGVRNLVAAVFRLENNRGAEEVLAIVTALLDWLQDPRQTSLRRAFTVWIQRVILADSSDTPREPLIELDEVRTMLAQRVQQWKQAWRAEGLAAGRRAGRKDSKTSVQPSFAWSACASTRKRRTPWRHCWSR